MFLSTTGDVLDAAQQDALERYIQAGGGWVGVHSATDTEYEWPWYGKLAGAYFISHPNNPNVRKATFRVLDKSARLHDRACRTSGSARTSSTTSSRSIRTSSVLVDIDEKSYEGGTNGDNHPMSWYHEYDGGRAWYTNMGHTDETFVEPPFLKHLLGGLRYAMGTRPLDYSRAKPEENRFTKVVLAETLDEPVELAVLPGESILFVERKGASSSTRPRTSASRRSPRSRWAASTRPATSAEDGLLGVAADPNFARNGWIYMFYSPAADAIRKNVLARYHA